MNSSSSTKARTGGPRAAGGSGEGGVTRAGRGEQTPCGSGPLRGRAARLLHWALAWVVVVWLAGCASAPAPAPLAADRPFAREILAFAESDRTNPPPRGAILFIGSSSIRLWKTLAQDFPEHRVINRGFGGSQIIDSVNYADRIVLPYRPRQIVLYAGGNDIHAGKTPEQVFADFQAFVQVIRRKLPRTGITYISIAPNPARWAEVDRVRAANRLIEDYAGRDPLLSFINVFGEMLGPDGNPKPDIYAPDRLHMNANGYAIWRKLVEPRLER